MLMHSDLSMHLDNPTLALSVVDRPFYKHASLQIVPEQYTIVGEILRNICRNARLSFAVSPGRRRRHPARDLPTARSSRTPASITIIRSRRRRTP